MCESNSINTYVWSQKLSQPYFTTCELKVGKIYLKPFHRSEKKTLIACTVSYRSTIIGLIK